MKKLSLKQASDVWSGYWQETKKESFKCEVLQDYSAVDYGPSLDAWLSGNKKKSMKLFTKSVISNNWGKQYKAKPIKRVRVHIVKSPRSKYLQWEIEVYKRNDWDEQIFLVPYEKIQNLKIPDGDFWIFDNTNVVQYHYKGRYGEPVSSTIYDSKDDISRFLALKTTLLKHKQPV